MKVLLINPPLRRMTGLASFYYPLGLASLAKVAIDLGHESSVYDVDMAKATLGGFSFNTEFRQMQNYLNVLNDASHPLWDEIAEYIRSYRPAVAGIRAQTTTYASALKVAEIIKKVSKDIVVVMGGPHPSVDSKSVLKCEDVDYVVMGEGEVTFAEFLKAMQNKSDFSSIKGLCFRSNGEAVECGTRGLVENIDSLSIPASELLAFENNYTSEDMGIIMASRGCPFSCTYCFHMWGKRVRYRSPEKIIEEITLVKERYGTQQFSFKDDTFTLKKTWVLELCERLNSSGLKINWDCTTRVEVLDRYLLKAMKRAGCNIVKIGVESGSEKILKDMKKGITKDQIRHAVKLMNGLGIFWSTYFIMGLPQESSDDIRQTLDFMKEIKPYYASIGLFKPFPGTEAFKSGVDMGILKPSMSNEEYFHVNPINYFYIDANKRTVPMGKETFDHVTKNTFISFDRYNKKIKNLFRRGVARRNIYLRDATMLVKDLKRLASWIRN